MKKILVTIVTFLLSCATFLFVGCGIFVDGTSSTTDSSMETSDSIVDTDSSVETSDSIVDTDSSVETSDSIVDTDSSAETIDSSTDADSDSSFSGASDELPKLPMD